jgi:hypothetical protein
VIHDVISRCICSRHSLTSFRAPIKGNYRPFCFLFVPPRPLPFSPLCSGLQRFSCAFALPLPPLHPLSWRFPVTFKPTSIACHFKSGSSHDCKNYEPFLRHLNLGGGACIVFKQRFEQNPRCLWVAVCLASLFPFPGGWALPGPSLFSPGNPCYVKLGPFSMDPFVPSPPRNAGKSSGLRGSPHVMHSRTSFLALVASSIFHLIYPLAEGSVLFFLIYPLDEGCVYLPSTTLGSHFGSDVFMVFNFFPNYLSQSSFGLLGPCFRFQSFGRFMRKPLGVILNIGGRGGSDCLLLSVREVGDFLYS